METNLPTPIWQGRTVNLLEGISHYFVWASTIQSGGFVSRFRNHPQYSNTARIMMLKVGLKNAEKYSGLWVFLWIWHSAWLESHSSLSSIYQSLSTSGNHIKSLEWNPRGLPSWPANWDMSSPPHHIASCGCDLGRHGRTCGGTEVDFCIFNPMILAICFWFFTDTTWLFQKIVLQHDFFRKSSFHVLLLHCISLRLLLMSPLSSSKIQHYRSSCQKDMVVNQIVTSGGFRWFDMVWRPSSTAPTWTCLDLFPSWFFSSPNSPWVIEASHFWPSAPTHPHFCWPLRILRIQKRFQRGSIEKATWFSESSLVKSGHPFGQLWKLCSIWKGPQPFLANRWKINEDIKCRKIW